MDKGKIASFLLVIVGLLVIIGSSYVVIAYSTAVLNAIVEFVSSNNIARLQQCGVTPPSQFNAIKDSFATILLPALWVGLPVVMLAVSALMFAAGFYYCKGRLADEGRKRDMLRQELEADIVRKAAARLAEERRAEPPRAEPAVQSPAPQPPAPAVQADAEDAMSKRRRR